MNEAMLPLLAYNTYFFDCDGVILQSNDIKTQAFRDALSGDSQDDIDTFIAYHENNGGISRYVKFEYYYKVIRREVNYTEYAEGAIKRYAENVFDGLMNADLVPGVLDFLDLVNEKQRQSIVVSASDQHELQLIFKERQLDHYFAEIFGSPKTKIDHLKRMLGDGLLSKPGLFFGDASSDMEAADFAKLDFCLVHGFSHWKDGRVIVETRDQPYFKDFAEMLESPWCQ